MPQGKVHAWVYGRPRKAPDLLVLHGGPGVPHNYLLPLAELARRRQVIFYDQIGCGASDKPKGGSPTTVDYYVNELAAVRSQLGLKRVVLYGHSWGTMLAASYMKTRPRGVVGVVMASPSLNAQWWRADADRNLKTLSPELQAAAAAKKFDSPEYKKAVDAYDGQFLFRGKNPPKELTDALAGMGDAYNAMCGPNEFEVTGTLKDFDATPDLPSIRVPVLYLVGEYDEASPETTRKYCDLTPRATMKIVDGASHLAMLEKPKEYVSALEKWLRRFK